jgi:predicted transcriptional regulator
MVMTEDAREVTVHVRLRPVEVERIDELAAADNRSRSAIIRECLTAGFPLVESTLRELREPLIEALRRGKS